MFRLARRLRFNYFKTLSDYRPNYRPDYRPVYGINNNIFNSNRWYFYNGSDNEDDNEIVIEKPKKNIWFINSDEGENKKDIQVPKMNINNDNTLTNNTLINDTIFDDDSIDNKPKREINYFERDDGKLFKKIFSRAYFPFAFINNIMFIVHDKQNKNIFYLDEFVPRDNCRKMPDAGESFKELLNNFNSVASYDNSYPNEKLFRCGPIIFNKTKLDKIVLLEPYCNKEGHKHMFLIVYHNLRGNQKLELQLDENDFNELHNFLRLQKSK